MREPDGTIHIPSEAPTAAAHEAAAPRTPTDRGHPCSCTASPWCTGPTGPGWLDCNRTCRSCHPPKRRRRSMNARAGDDA